jgi:hypothetical protein
MNEKLKDIKDIIEAEGLKADDFLTRLRGLNRIKAARQKRLEETIQWSKYVWMLVLF